MNAFELAILRVARQYEERMGQKPLDPKEQRQAELVIKWAKQVRDRQESNSANNKEQT